MHYTSIENIHKVIDRSSWMTFEQSSTASFKEIGVRFQGSVKGWPEGN